jgi:outer membrane protein with beta-barrel domain
MYHKFAIGHTASGLGRMLRFALAACGLLMTSQAFAQSYVGKFEVYEGFMYLNSPNLSLGEPGYHIQAGMRARRWLSLGFDYSRGTGDTALTSSTLINSLQQQLNSAISSGILPAGYKLAVPIGTRTATYTAGPQFPYRHFSKFTPFIRPSIGAVKESAIVRPADPITTLIVNTLSTTRTLQDWKAFYGVGGGVALNFSKHFSLVVQADYVHDNLFDNILKPRNTVRLSIGPGYQFGRNVTR